MNAKLKVRIPEEAAADNRNFHEIIPDKGYGIGSALNGGNGPKALSGISNAAGDERIPEWIFSVRSLRYSEDVFLGHYSVCHLSSALSISLRAQRPPEIAAGPRPGWQMGRAAAPVSKPASGLRPGRRSCRDPHRPAEGGGDQEVSGSCHSRR